MCVIFSEKKNTQQLYIIVSSFHLYKTAVWSRHCWRWRHSRSPYPLDCTSVRRLRCANGCGCVQVTMNCGWGRGRGRVEVVFNSTQKSNRIGIGKNLAAESQEAGSAKDPPRWMSEQRLPSKPLAQSKHSREWHLYVVNNFFYWFDPKPAGKNSKLRLIEQDSDVR